MTQPKIIDAQEHNIAYDLMRFSAIFFVVQGHMTSGNYFVNIYDWSYFGIDPVRNVFGQLERYVLMGIFVFLSGYLLALKKYPMDNLYGVYAFLRKRFIRIFPLYWAALFLYVGLYYLYTGKELGFINGLLHIFGLQLLHNQPIFTIWFVSLITIYYFVFACIQYIESRWNLYYPIWVMTFFFFIGLQFALPAMDPRLLLHWPAFAVGMLFARNRIKVTAYGFWASLIVFMSCSYIYVQYFDPPENMPRPWTFLLVTGLVSFIMITFTLMTFYICGKVKPGRRATKFIMWGSYASFVAFLLHRPLLQITKELTRSIDNFSLVCVIFIIVFIAVFPIGFVVQRIHDWFMELLRTRLFARPLRNT